jgi:hypothetical protein
LEICRCLKPGILKPTAATPLGAGGMTAWLSTFCRGALDALPENLRETVVAETVALLKPGLCDEEGQWTADYVRLRFSAKA